MPQIPKHRKVKRATVLIKRAQCLRNYPRNKIYKPLYEKLKSNNNSLARALSKEKQECQLLFSQNVALVAEVQDLGLACNKRDMVISNVLKNAKEMLKMLVSITSYVTNTISSCQEFASPNSNAQMTCNSAGQRESNRRLSIKSPARGVVKPMVSGHTITKPTINLSRLNMQRINSQPNLSTIQEAPSTSNRNQDLNNPISSVSDPIRQIRCETNRVCRLPERLTAASPRVSENERRLSKKSNRHSGRLSGKHLRPKSGRYSAPHANRSSNGYMEIGSPRVKLNDVSKLLQNSQSINIRMLTENQIDVISESAESSDGAAADNSSTNIIIPETQVSVEYSEEENGQSERDVNDESDDESITMKSPLKNANIVQNNISDWEDPLEGPSWLFSNPRTVPCSRSKNVETNHINLSKNHINQTRVSINAANLDNMSDSSEEAESPPTLPTLIKCGNRIQEHNTGEHYSNNDDHHNAYSTEKTEENPSNGGEPPFEEEPCKAEDEVTMNFARFVTRRRGCFQNTEEDVDDFTLMYMRQPVRNMHFDINDLNLPVLEGSAIVPPAPNEIEPEITTTIQRITQNCPIPSVSNDSMNETQLNETTVKLPLPINNDFDGDATLITYDQHDITESKEKIKMNFSNLSKKISCKSEFGKNKGKQKKSSVTKKDPSTAKVVLRKLNASHVKQRVPSPDEMYSHDFAHSSRSPVSLGADNSSDSESSTSSRFTSNRPRRRKAPTNLQEPNLLKKLRRNE
ncbi:hypothetical protein KM043_014178 [Ampulex compressa]|nr:hypothetical protein KM043_014178 [Ampulex compressa]